MRVLIADDSPVERQLLESTLTKWGHEVIVTCDGNEAWKVLQRENICNLAVFDWMMPGLNGVELCKKLKNRMDAPFIYTILLTSKNEKKDLVVALDSGSHDFITKPFNSDELKSRVAVGVRILEYEDALAEKNKQLARYVSEMEILAEEQAKQLIHADRLAALGIMSAGIAHEINNPTSFISGNIQILQRFWETIEWSLSECLKNGGKYKDKLNFILEEMPNILSGMLNGVVRITRIVNALKTYSRFGGNGRTTCRINECVEQALELCHNKLKHHVTVEKILSRDLPEILADIFEIEQVLVNLFINAADAMEQQETGTLLIKTSAIKDRMNIVVEDTGPGIQAEIIDNIWQPFFTTKTVGKGTGFGLSISQRIVVNHGGKITVENKPEGGARFIIELPVK